MGNALDCIVHNGKASIQTKASRYPPTTGLLSLPSSSSAAAAASSGTAFFSGRPSLFSSSSSRKKKKNKNEGGLSGNGAIDYDHESSSVIQEQAIAAALLFRHHQRNGSLPNFIRSTSFVYPSPGNSNKQGGFPKSSSTRQRSLSDPMITPQKLVNSQRV